MSVDDSYTKALLHFDGSDESVTFTDESGKSWTGAGTAQLDTAQKKFGTASLLLDGNSDYIYTADHADWNLSTGDFTIDCWVKRTSRSAYMTICAQSTTADNTHKIQLYITDSERLAFLAYNASGVRIAQIVGDSGAPLGDDNWHHVALVRSGTSAGCLKLYVDGTASTLTTSIDLAGTAMPDLAYQLTIGRCDSTGNESYFNGWIDEFRFSKGIARWTANFTPPTSPYSNEDFTTESAKASDSMVGISPTEFTSESAKASATFDGFVLEDFTSESAVASDVFGNERTAYGPTVESAEVTDLMDALHLVDDTTESAVAFGLMESAELIRKRIRFPNLQGKHLSLKLESSTDGSFALYYLRHKMFKTKELTSDQKHPNTQGSHIGIKLSNSGSDVFTLMYVSEKMQLVTT
jgi:hypothetical protein